MQSSVIKDSSTTSAIRVAPLQLLMPLLVFLLGSSLVLAVGFAPIDAVHNAAHDTRHTAAFPCH